MHMTTYHQFENDNTEAMARNVIAPLVRLMPQWVRHVYVYAYDNLEGEAMASCCSEPDYRRVTINLSCMFFDRPATKQYEVVVHEFFHAMLGEVSQWVERRMIAPIKETNKELYRHVGEEFTERMERVVQELTFMFLDLDLDSGIERKEI